MISPPNLKKGDKIAIAAPARKINEEEMIEDLKIINSYGYEVVYNSDLYAADNQFAGSDEHRARVIQMYLDDDDVRAILFARGGYGSARIIDDIDFSGMRNCPKWLAGYSDITVFLNHIVMNYGIETLHCSMPINFHSNTPESLDRLFNIMKGNRRGYTFKHQQLNRQGKVSGTLLGGNLSVLYSLLGSSSFPSTKNTIMFLEDLDEYLYHIDRMMVALRRSGKIEQLGGLIIGAMNNMNDNAIPFGKTAEEIISEAVSEFDFPVCFGFPAGHINNNLPLVIGADIQLKVNDNSSEITYV